MSEVHRKTCQLAQLGSFLIKKRPEPIKVAIRIKHHEMSKHSRAMAVGLHHFENFTGAKLRPTLL